MNEGSSIPDERVRALPRLAAAVLAVAICACGNDERRPDVVATDEARTPPTRFTVEANRRVAERLELDDPRDFEDARRGFVAAREDPVIRDGAGRVVWNTADYDFQQGPAPDSVNPSLWRQARLNSIHGLFRVSERIYQVRGYDLANMTLVRGDTGWIVIDPLTTQETAAAALELANLHLGARPVVAVIYTHSHIDHFGGARGVVGDRDLERGVAVIAPEGFVTEAVSENVLAGNAMSRRAAYMYGFFLGWGPRGHVDSGLGKAPTVGTFGLVAPTELVSDTGTEKTIDGVRIVFQNTPDAEAPAEMMFYLPDEKALCGAENVTHTLHNLYTLRGAKVRDALRWSGYIDEALRLFADAEVVFASHHWPTWGHTNVRDYLAKQRDLYKYLHDQTLRLANHGETMDEIAESLEMPESLDATFAARGYYGTVRHDAKAVYQRYFGWFDGNPSNLDPLPPVEEARRYVEFMGGAEALVEKARASYESGDYRWVATVVRHAVFADPGDEAARELLAAAYDQLGYQAESAPWRDFYLSGATELRRGIGEVSIDTRSPDVVAAMPTELFFDALAVRLDGSAADGFEGVFNFEFTDLGETHVVEVSNAVLRHRLGAPREDADATVKLARSTWNRIATGRATMPGKILTGEVDVDGSRIALLRFFALLDEFSPTFPIVTP